MTELGAAPTAPVRETRNRAALLAAAAIALIPALAKLVFYPSYPGSDDSFIHLAVVDRILAGQGWGVMPGEPVNLSSSPVYTALLIVLRGFGDIGVAQVASAACAVATVLVLFALARRVTGSVRLALTVAVVAATNIQLWRWTGAVMETTLGLLFAALIALGVYRMRDRLASAHAVFGLGALVGVATLCRFELGLLLPLVALHLWLAWGSDRSVVARLAWLVPGFAVGVLPWLVFSLAYFGTPIPTTFGAKTTGWHLVNVSVAGDLGAAVVSGLGPALLVGVAALVAVVRKGLLPAVLREHLLLFAWPIALFAFYYVKTPSLQSPGRYYLPGMATIPVAIVVLLAAAGPLFCRRNMLAAFAAVSLVVGVVANLLLVAPTLRSFNDGYRAAQVEAAGFLRANCTGRALVSVDIGIVTREGVGRCGIDDGGALASPALKGMSLDEQVAATGPEFVVQSIGQARGEWLADHPSWRLVLSRPYVSHGVGRAGAQEWLNIYATR